MNAAKRLIPLALLAALLVGVVPPALAGGPQGPQLKQRRTAAVLEGDTAWVALSWEGRGPDITDFQISAVAKTTGASVGYPANTDPFSSLSDNSTLTDGEVDFTALRVEMPYEVRWVRLAVTATWVQSGESRSRTYQVFVPSARYRGEDVALVTLMAGSVPVATPTWLGVEWSGLAPRLENVTMIVAGPVGISIVYPAEGPSTSLHYDDLLEDGETDVARFLVDASGLTPGSYALDVTLTYMRGGTGGSAAGTVSFDVTA